MVVGGGAAGAVVVAMRGARPVDGAGEVWVASRDVVGAGSVEVEVGERGVLVDEWLSLACSSGAGAGATGTSGVGAGVGRFKGTLAKLAVATVMWLVITVAAFWP